MTTRMPIKLQVFPDRHVECFICEQNLAGVAIGLACRDRCVAFISTFAAFLTRAFDNFRMGVISQVQLQKRIQMTRSVLF